MKFYLCSCELSYVDLFPTLHLIFFLYLVALLNKIWRSYSSQSDTVGNAYMYRYYPVRKLNFSLNDLEPLSY